MFDLLRRTSSSPTTSSIQGKTLYLNLLIFIDSFGLYRNVYRSIIGQYFILDSLLFQERARRTNIFPFTLGPYGSNFPNIVKLVEARIAILDKGIFVNINSEDMLLYILILAYLGDIPQQQKNLGIKTQRIVIGYQYYFIPQDQRGNLEYNLLVNGRYYYQTMSMREEIDLQGGNYTIDQYAK